MTDEIDHVVEDPVATMTLRRPATLNALTHPMLGAFREAVDAAAADPRVVGIVVTGEGRIFSKRGLIAEHGTTWIVPRLVGTAPRWTCSGRRGRSRHPRRSASASCSRSWHPTTSWPPAFPRMGEVGSSDEQGGPA